MTGLIKVTSGSLTSLVKEATQPVPVPGESEELYLLLDGSGSMHHDEGWPVAVDAATALLKSCTAMTRAGIIVFSDKAKVVCKAMMPAAAAECLIKARPPYEYTMLGEAIKQALLLLAESKAKVKRMIAMTDGATAEMEDCLELATKAKTAGIIIDAVGFGVDEETKGFLLLLAANGNGVYKDACNAQELVKQFKLLEATKRGLLKA